MLKKIIISRIITQKREEECGEGETEENKRNVIVTIDFRQFDGNFGVDVV